MIQSWNDFMSIKWWIVLFMNCPVYDIVVYEILFCDEMSPPLWHGGEEGTKTFMIKYSCEKLDRFRPVRGLKELSVCTVYDFWLIFEIKEFAECNVCGLSTHSKLKKYYLLVNNRLNFNELKCRHYKLMRTKPCFALFTLLYSVNF